MAVLLPWRVAATVAHGVRLFTIGSWGPWRQVPPRTAAPPRSHVDPSAVAREGSSFLGRVAEARGARGAADPAATSPAPRSQAAGRARGDASCTSLLGGVRGAPSSRRRLPPPRRAGTRTGARARDREA